MLETEYIKSMNKNYERIQLKDKPEEKRYQYCIVGRGGIRGLLPCSLRYINGDAFLYYEISSKQSVSQIFFGKKKIDREWIKDFVWNIGRIRQELARFLLDEKNLVWFPETVYQDLEDNRWSFIYYPYYDGESGFRQFLEFIVEKLNHEDEELIECVYNMYDQYTTFGDMYLQDKIQQDVAVLDKKWNGSKKKEIEEDTTDTYEETPRLPKNIKRKNILEEAEKTLNSKKEDSVKNEVKKKKTGLFAFLEGNKKKEEELRRNALSDNAYEFETGEARMVAEPEPEYNSHTVENEYEEGYGKTIYIENVAEAADTKRRLYFEEGQILVTLSENAIVIGKKKDEADVIIENSTISRIHARISYENGNYILEDLNSTNGTFKNGLRLRPYEKRKLMDGDEIRLGGVILTYK